MLILNIPIKSLKCDWIAREASIHLELSTHCTKVICESCNCCPDSKASRWKRGTPYRTKV